MSARDEQKERTRQDILSSAARLLKERGLSGTSVAEVMKGAGLTVGGFYAHFDSKEALLGASLRQAMRQMWSTTLAAAAASKEEQPFDYVLRRYLSRSHRDNPAQGCPLPAVVGEATQAGAPVREALADELRDYADTLADTLGEKGPQRRQRALAAIALMYGGLSLARALRGTRLSEDILEACRDLARTAFRNG